ncbi:MAG: ribosome-associated protein [Chloroflexota bacterium]|nr:ribosome-associated protein [Chloroflexota bacterium]
MLKEKDTIQIARDLVDALEDKKAEDIVLMDLQGVTVFTDYFVICSGTSDRMLRSLVRAANDAMAKDHGMKGKIAGSASNGWIAVDFDDIVLHVFSPQQREFYQLEELWSEAKTLLRVK